MKPGARIADLQVLARATYRKAGVPDPDSALIFFHGLGLSHMELELMTADGKARGGNWSLEEAWLLLSTCSFQAASSIAPGARKWWRSAATVESLSSRGVTIR
jgi:hypothetical protein